MQKVIKKILPIASALAIAIAAPVQADDLDKLLDQVKSGALEKTKEAAQLEKRFATAGTQKANIVSQLKAQRAQLEGQSDRLEASFASNEDALNKLRNQRQSALGDLKELFGGIQQIAGETEAAFETSLISAQFPGREKFLGDLNNKIATSNDLVTAAEIETLWKEILNELVQQGKVSSFTAPVAMASGAREDRPVTRVGVFNLVGGGKYLTYGKGGVSEMARQPEGRFLSSASALQDAGDGNVEFYVDPTKGTLLGANVERPSLGERIEQGGAAGYVLIVMGLIALVIAIWRIAYLYGEAGRVNKQVKNTADPSPKNSLGRVLKVYRDNSTSDTEALELKLSEAIMKETPKLNAWLMLLKIISVVAPLMGLLGTVLGMIETFQQITLFGAGDPKLMAGGISTALVTTVMGLCVAIPTVLLHTIAASKAKHVQEVLEEQSAGMVARQAER